MILPGVRIPEPFRPYGLVLPDGYDVRQDREHVYLTFASEDIVESWTWANIGTFALTSLIIDAAKANWWKRAKYLLCGDETPGTNE